MAERAETRRFHGEKNLVSPLDDPPNSRLFIICSKQLTEDDFRAAFAKFGAIEEIWVVKDRQTGDRKGVTYIKYAKTSEAARALEAMNGKTIGNSNRHIKVMIAASREQGSKREGNEDEKIQRLFVIVPKTMSDEDLYNIFKVYGEIDYATVIRDKESRESKGFAYIKYFKFSHAAAAFEQCDRKFKAVFAEPRKPRVAREPSDRYFSESMPRANSASSSAHHPPSGGDGGPDHNCTRLSVTVNSYVAQDLLWKVFDLIPGLDFCNFRVEGRTRPLRTIGTVVYNNPQAATYACEKLHGFEYPPGSPLTVKMDYETGGGRCFTSETPRTSLSTLNRSGCAAAAKSDILHLAETIAQATSLIQAAGLSPEMLQSQMGAGTLKRTEPLCNVELPDAEPLAHIDTEPEARCFVVCSPQPPSPSVLRDVFSRFGHLIDVYMLFNRNCGYAKYASKESAEKAISVLHGAEVCGVRLKVMKAEERDNRRKRQRLDDDFTT